MVDIQSAAAEIRRGKKERKNKLQHENITITIHRLKQNIKSSLDNEN